MTQHRFQRKIRTASTATALLVAASAASAAIWQPAVGNYGDAANWDTAVVPGAADTAYIPNGGVANLADGGSYSLTNLYVNTETTPTVPGSTLNLTNGTLAVTGWTRTGNGSTVAIDGGTLNAKDIIVGQLTTAANPSQLNISSGNLNFTGTLSVGRSDDATMNIEGGTVAGASFHFGSGTGVVGTVNHSAGTVTARVRGSEAWVGGFGPGIYNLSGTGVVTSTTRLTVGHQADGEFNVTGGTLNAPSNITQVGSSGGNGVLSVSGGDVNLQAGLQLGSGGTTGSGTLRVTGSGGDITLTNAGIRAMTNSTLQFVITPDGISSVDIDGTGNNLVTYIDGVLDIDLAGYSPAFGETFDLIVSGADRNGSLSAFPDRTFVNGFDISNMTLAPEDVGGWEYEVVRDTTLSKSILRVTAVPEPTGLAVLGLAGMALAARRRRA